MNRKQQTQIYSPAERWLNLFPPINRKFGIELECVGISKNNAYKWMNQLYPTCITDKDDTDPYVDGVWKITTDPSVPNGIEIVSPPLRGIDGLVMCAQAATWLRLADVRVNANCAFHVHVDISDFKAKDAINAIVRYAKYEHLIDQMLHPDRGNSVYCHSMIPVASDGRVLRARSIPRIIDYAADHSSGWDVKYFKLNLESWERYGTMEFRQHHATLSQEAIINWIYFCLGFTEASYLGSSVRQDNLIVPWRTKEDQSFKRCIDMVRYLKTKRTLEQICERFDRSPSTILRYMRILENTFNVCILETKRNSKNNRMPVKYQINDIEDALNSVRCGYHGSLFDHVPNVVHSYYLEKFWSIYHIQNNPGYTFRTRNEQ